MKMMIETFVSVIFISVLVVVVSQIICSQIAINSASSFHTNVVQVIEESDFDSEVIDFCIEQAFDKGYELEVAYNKSSTMQCSTCNSTWEVEEGAYCPNCNSTNVYEEHLSSDGIVTMTYKVELAMLGIEKEGSLQSNAR